MGSYHIEENRFGTKVCQVYIGLDYVYLMPFLLWEEDEDNLRDIFMLLLFLGDKMIANIILKLSSFSDYSFINYNNAD